MTVEEFFQEIGKIIFFLFGKYYELMRWVQQTTANIVGTPASILLTFMALVFFPLVVIVSLFGTATKETYSWYEGFWNITVKIVALMLIIFVLLFVLR